MKFKKIFFPSDLLLDLIIHLSKLHKVNIDNFGFVFKYHFNKKERQSFKFPKDNTPTSIIKKVNRGQKLTAIESKTLKKFEQIYKLVSSRCENALLNAKKISKINKKTIKLYIKSQFKFGKYQATKKSSKNNINIYQQPLHIIALHANIIGGAKTQLSKVTNQMLHSYIFRRIAVPNAFMNGSIVKSTNPIDQSTLKAQYKSKYNKFLSYAKDLAKMASSKTNGWISLTFTVPAEMHPSNINWTGQTPKDVSVYFNKKLATFRKLLNKKKIKIKGFWTTECHHDSCPHFNFFIIFEKSNKKNIISLLKSSFPAENKKSRRIVVKNKSKTIKDALKIIRYFGKTLYPNFESENINEYLKDNAISSIFNFHRHGSLNTLK
jgi:hypothetical protein